MSIFEFEDYKKFVLHRIQEMPRQGRGEFQRLAGVLQMHTTSISQVFKGQKDLTLEQAARLCHDWGLNQNESNYLLTLVELARAGSKELKKILRERLKDIQNDSQLLKNRIPKDSVLSESDRYRFYSEWYYSAIRLLYDIPEFRNIDRVAKHLNLPPQTVNEALQFLLSCGLLVENKGQVHLGPSRTYVEAASSLVHRHHANWRAKVVEKYPKMNHDMDLAVTSPMVLSREDALKVRTILLNSVEKILAINKPSPSEELHLLNIDWMSL